MRFSTGSLYRIMSRSSHYSKQREKEPYSTHHVIPQSRAANALLKFCKEHNYQSEYLIEIESCVNALESKSIRKAVMSFKKVPLGGNGCFNDWWPPVVYPHETKEYVWAEFEALVERWARLMSLSES